MQRKFHKPALTGERPALRKGLDFLFSLQREDGSFTGDYGGSLFLTPMYVCLTRVMGIDPDERTREGLRSYLLSRQNGDGSFGLHVEGEGTVFVTSLAYASLRILGLPKEEPPARGALRWLSDRGGPAAGAPWGKFVLALMGLYAYDGIDPVLPELWLLPEISPLHPSKMWCHSRMVYLPMAWLYARRTSAPPDPVLEQVRDELYGGGYESVDWSEARKRISPTDVYKPPTVLLKTAYRAMRLYERLNLSSLRERSLRKVLDHIRHEDDSTDFINLGPVNKLFNTVVEWSIDPSSERFGKAASRLPLYLWEEKDGIRMNGYNSVQLWDTAFSLQAALTTGLWCHYGENIRRIYGFVRDNQVRDDVQQRRRYYRDPSRGGWPFSNLPHGWPITDCTAEGFKTAVLAAGLRLEGGRPLIPPGERIGEEMLKAAVELILYFQNGDGGWASYEKRRGGKWYELLNPSCVFADIMTDHSYVECSSSCVQALALALSHFPGWREGEIRAAIDRGRGFILSAQRGDGSWEGSWGVCFTYGTWFATLGLRAAGLAAWDGPLAAAARFLVGKQNRDGGWGEHCSSCSTRTYVAHARSQPVMTAWAAMALMAASGLHHPPSAVVRTEPAAHDFSDEALVIESIERGASFLKQSQEGSGDWTQTAITGVFNKTCMITYDNYRRYFPLWALGIYTCSRP